MKKLFWIVPFVAAASLSMWRLDAAGVTVTFAPPGNVFPAGPDFATDVIGDPWDMNSMSDISIDPQQRTDWATLGVSAGTGVPNAIGGFLNGPSGLSILYQSHYNVISTQRNGRTFPIDTNAYRRLSFKIKTDVGHTAIIWWFHRPYSHPSGEGIGGGILSGLTTGGAYQVQSVDLSSIPNQTGEVWTQSPTTAGLRIDPNPNPENVFFDWVRLTAADGTPQAKMQTVQWAGGSGNATVTVTDSTNTTFTVCASVAGGSCSWNYGIVPPGNYTVTVTRGASNGTAPFRVNNPPTVQVTRPSMTSGQDYATTFQPSPWDMNDPGDIDNDWIGSDHITESWPGTEFIGTSDGACVNDCATQPTGDPEVYMLANNEPSISRGSIDSTKYRYLTFNMQIDHAYDLFAGSVGRILFGHASTFQNGISPHYNLAVSAAFLAWPGNVTYSIDLGALGVGMDQGILPSPYSPSPSTWASSPIRQLRIDPHEFAQVVQFHLDDVKLTAMSEVAPGGTFQINFNRADADAGDTVSVRLFRDDDRNGANGMTEITPSPLTGVSSFNWNTGSTPTGVYYIFALVSDGIDTRGWYSNAPLRIGVPSNGPPEPYMSIDVPANGATVGTNFTVSGWAIDKGAATGTGIDQVHLWAFPSGGGSPTGLGVVGSFTSRPDIGAAFGSQFTNSGYSLNATLPVGSYTITAYGHSTLTGTFNIQMSRSITVSGPVPNPAMSLDRPLGNGSSGTNVTVSGWAIDRGVPSGSGVDQVHVYAFPTSGGSPIGVVAFYGQSRPDVGAAFGGQFTNSGFSVVMNSVPAGTYNFTAYMHSTVSGTFSLTATAANVTVNPTTSNPQMNIDAPSPGASRTRPFTISGWAVDTGAVSGPGIDAIHVWAFPVGGAPQFFVGVGTYGLSRPDVGAYIGSSQFNNSGYSITINSGNVPSPGAYDFYVFAHSTVTGNFPIARIVRVTVN
jgi:hypothetical protein